MSPEKTRDKDHHPHKRFSPFGRLRAYFLAGILVTAPLAITVALAWWVIDFVDQRIVPLIPAQYNPDIYLREVLGVEIGLPGFGLLVLVVGITLIGALTAGFLGRTLVRWGEQILDRMPVIRSLYSASKQILETVLQQQSKAFRQAVLVEYPRRGLWAIAFVTAPTTQEIRRHMDDLGDDDFLNVFLPTTPNPTSGFLLFVPAKDAIPLGMSVEEAVKMVISAGIVTPPDRKAAERLKGGRILPPDEVPTLAPTPEKISQTGD